MFDSRNMAASFRTPSSLAPATFIANSIVAWPIMSPPFSGSEQIGVMPLTVSPTVARSANLVTPSKISSVLPVSPGARNRHAC